MFDEIIFDDITDFGLMVPPILPHILYQTKMLDNELTVYRVANNYNKDLKPRALDTKTYLQFYTSTHSYGETTILEESLRHSSPKERAKILFFANLFTGDWLEYEVTIFCGKILSIDSIYNSINGDEVWTIDELKKNA